MGTRGSAWAENAQDRVVRAGLRSGGARTQVIDYLGGQSCCLSAQEIHDGIRARGGRAGIASVYRALDTLAALGLVQRVELGDGTARFEPAQADGDHHHHLVCDDCGRVEPFSDSGLESALGRIAGARGFAMAEHEVVLRGACDDCRDG